MRVSVGRKVKRWRTARGLSERAAAAEVGVSQPTLRAVEANDVGGISLDVAVSFIRALGGTITVNDFLPAGKRSPDL